MNKQVELYDGYIRGILSICIICIIPLISPITYFITHSEGTLSYIMIMVSIVGIFYEFFYMMSDEILCARLKFEKMAIILWISLFALADIIVLICRSELGGKYIVGDYLLFGYVIVPLVVAIYETYRCIKQYVKSNTPDSDNKIASGPVIDI